MKNMNMVIEQSRATQHCNFEADGRNASNPELPLFMSSGLKDTTPQNAEELDLAAWVNDVPY